ncbi:unnamed protein product [Coffea canephora]|uniref:Uncharacterized protein n=1 Tax=Coffea canephora TaxID=49390 RepID=A0A068TR42_COFCA|nr:unnamed protein product [Coffea canephora]
MGAERGRTELNGKSSCPVTLIIARCSASRQRTKLEKEIWKITIVLMSAIEVPLHHLDTRCCYAFVEICTRKFRSLYSGYMNYF